jgi:glc operon protein GlcG
MLDEEAASRVLEAAVGFARTEGLSVSIAVVDDGGYLMALRRLGQAHKLTPQMAISKAYTSAIYRRPTAEMAEMPAELLASARHAGLETLLVMPGAVPILKEGVVIGAIGVAGAAPEVDATCAATGAAALDAG